MGAKSFLVTGGAGFLGAPLVRRLLEAGHFVRVLDNLSRGSAARLAGLDDRFEFVEADVRDAAAVLEAAGGMDSVCHLASVNGTAFFYSLPDLVLDVAVRGMVNVLDACLKQGVRELAVASSSEVYHLPPETPTDESAPLAIPDPLNPRYSYAGGKVISELMALNFGRKHFDRALVFRPHNVYGPDMGREHVIPQFVERACALIERQPEGRVRFPIQGDGTETRAFVHVDDFTAGLLAVLERGKHMEIYHVGNDEEVAIAELVRLLFAHFERDYEIVPGERAAGSPVRRCPDITKLKGLGYRPRISLAQGLPGVIRWYCAHREGA